MLKTARQSGELGEHVPDVRANIVPDPGRPIAHYLDAEELERLGPVLDKHDGEPLGR